MQMSQNSGLTVVLPRCLIDKRRTDCAYGVLIGWKDRSEAEFFIANIVYSNGEQSFATLKEDLESYLPAGYDVLGIWKPDTDMMLIEEEISEFAEMTGFPTEKSQFLIVGGVSNAIKASLVENDGICWFLASSVEVLSPDPPQDFVIRRRSVAVRLKTTIDLEIQVPNETGDLQAELLDSFDKLENRFCIEGSENQKVQCSSTPIVFKIKNNDFLLGCCQNHNNFTYNGLSIDQSSIFDLWKLFHPDEKRMKNKDLLYTQDCIDFVLLEDITLKPDEQNGPCTRYVPVIHYEATEFASYVVKLSLNPTVVCSQNTKLQDLHRLLCQALIRQIRSARSCMETFSDFRENKLVAPMPYLFIPPSIGHPLTLVFPNTVTDENLEKRRRDVCETWNLPTDRPYIRRINRYLYPHEQGLYLRNVHLLVPPSGINGGICATVCGNYEYHHYMQDNFNDNGWGCAYRSFQTVWSWFLLQGYTEKPVPNHKEIQQALVDIGDRPANFIGSKQWIGSLELSFCLSHLIDIESKIMNVSSGGELVTKVRELIAHFQTEGTPIMIGGGVLAHTILGVHFFEDSGDVKFLVLDPHYTSEENIKTIIDKGWCAWKPSTFWGIDAFYNLLLPQKPKSVV